jgi:nucleotide-binding universal stress UspA family protein
MKILISIDTSKSAETVLHEAKNYIKLFPDAEVHVFTVVDMPPMPTERDFGTPIVLDTLEEHAEEELHIAEKILGGKISISDEIGHPVDEILKKARSLPCDLLIMGTHGRTGLDHLLIGSVAEKVLRHITCNTLIIPVKNRGLKDE